MKKKLTGLVAVTLAMSMATSAFAATPRGTGDVDGDGMVTANDVLMILKGLANDNAEANVDGSSDGVDGLDAHVAFAEMLQPKTVTEDLALRVYTENYSIGKVPVSVITGAENLGSTVSDNEKGTGIVDDTVSLSTATSVGDAINKLVDLVTDTSAERISNQLDKVYFSSATKGDVYLRNADGWAMFCYAVQPIVPMEKEKADLINADINNPTKPASSDEEIAAKQAQVDALKAMESVIVGTKVLDASDIRTIKDNFLIAFPNTITSDEVNETVARVLSITGAKYEFKANDEVITTTSEFVNKLAGFMPGYQSKTMADFRTTFGDKLEISAQNTATGAAPIKAVIEVSVTAGIRQGEATTVATTEATTVAPTEATTVATTEATTEATTVATTEATTEAPTEGTTEAPVSGGWTFDISDLTAGADKEALTGSVGTNNFFSVVGEVVKRISTNTGAVTSIELTKAAGGAIEFTVTGNANVSFDASSTGGSNTSAIALVGTDGTYYVNTTVTGSSSGRTTFTATVPAGTYRIISPLDENNNRGARVYSVTVTA